MKRYRMPLHWYKQNIRNGTSSQTSRIVLSTAFLTDRLLQIRGSPLCYGSSGGTGLSRWMLCAIVTPSGAITDFPASRVSPSKYSSRMMEYCLAAFKRCWIGVGLLSLMAVKRFGFDSMPRSAAFGRINVTRLKMCAVRSGRCRDSVSLRNRSYNSQ